MLLRYSLLAATGLLLSSAPPSPTSARTPNLHSQRRNVTLEERNRAIVLRFSEAVFNRQDFSVAEELLAEDYVQHNPRIPTGRQAFIASYKGVLAAHPGLHSEILRSGASGDLVFTHVHVTDATGKYHIALVNIFRLVKGKIVEHWDVLQPVPETAANANTMF